MENETIFLDGFSFKRPREGAPAFVKGNMAFKTADFIEFLKKHDNNGWVNADLLLSKDGTKLYAKLNTWKKPSEQVNSPVDIVDDMAF